MPLDVRIVFEVIRRAIDVLSGKVLRQYASCRVDAVFRYAVACERRWAGPRAERVIDCIQAREIASLHRFTRHGHKEVLSLSHAEALVISEIERPVCD